MKSKKNKKVLVTQEEISLSTNSECINRYPNLLSILEKFKLKRKPIYKDDIEYLKESDNHSYSILRFSFSNFIEECSSEWKQLRFLGKENIPCELCGNTMLEYNFEIVNIKNNTKKMIVGSSCIGKFPKMDSNGMDNKVLLKNAKKIERINLINNRYENITDLMNSWKEFYLDFEVLLPQNVDERFNKLIIDSQKFYEQFITEKIIIQKLDEFNVFIEEFKKLKKESSEFYELNKNSKYICDKKIIKWLNRHKYNNLKQSIIDNDGLINNSISKKLYSVDFINKFEDKITDCFKRNKFNIYEINEEMIIVSYKTKENINVKLYLYLKEFMEKFSDILFDEDKYIKEDYIIDNFKFLWNEDNLKEYLDVLNIRIKKTKYYLKRIFKEENLVNFIKVERSGRESVELQGHILINNLKSSLNKSAENTKLNVNTILNKVRSGSWKSKEEVDKYNKQDIREAMKNY